MKRFVGGERKGVGNLLPERPEACFAQKVPDPFSQARRGFTLVELMMATLLTLMLMLVVVGLFAAVSASIRNSRATMEMAGRLRAAKRKLQLDLEGRTVTVFPPARPAAGKGYLEIVEGPLGPVMVPDWFARDFDRPRTPDAIDPIPYERDTTVADFDDILMFTTRSRAGPFVGRYQNGTISSYEAEVAWFVRGRTLYRRVLLIAPQVISDSAVDTNGNSVIDSVDLTDSNGNVHSFYQWYDISARPEGYDTSTTPGRTYWVPNTLGDLTKRENRFAHRVHAVDVAPPMIHGFPYRISRWGQLGLPTLRECADPNWMTWPDPAGMPFVTPVAQIDLWASAAQAHPWPETDPRTGTLLAYPGAGVNSRVAEDVILTNVIGFDVKVWDPGAPVFWGVRDNAGTPGNLADDTPDSSLVVSSGDPGYALALAHFVDEYTNRPLSADNRYVPRRFGAYVNLGYGNVPPPPLVYSPPASVVLATVPPRTLTIPRPHFNSVGSAALPRVYDTWSFHYEHDGLNQDGDVDANGAPLIDEGTDGFDNDGNGIVDDLFEREAIAPYPVPLRGIQIKIRTFEPDSRQVREVTVVADFSPK